MSDDERERLVTYRLQVGDYVVHKLDPLNRAGYVVKEFNWLGQRKLIVSRGGERLKDYDHQFRKAY